MKSLLILAALLISFTPSLAHAAGEVVNKDNAFAIPQSKGGAGPDSQAKWAMPSLSRIEAISTAVQAGLGQGLVRGICAIANTSAGGYVSLYDTINPVGLTAATGGTGSLLASFPAKILTPGWDTSKPACEFFDRGIPYTAGLAWIASATTVRATLIFDTIKLP